MRNILYRAVFIEEREVEKKTASFIFAVTESERESESEYCVSDCAHHAFAHISLRQTNNLILYSFPLTHSASCIVVVISGVVRVVAMIIIGIYTSIYM